MKINSIFAFLLIIISSLVMSGLIFCSCRNFPKYEYKFENKFNSINYPQTEEKEFFETAYRFVDSNQEFSNEKIVAGIIPHHLLAADLIADFFVHLEKKDYDTIVLIGPNHPNDGEEKIIVSENDWNTPYGLLENDTQFCSDFLEIEGVGIDEETMLTEHSVISEISFIKKTFPDAKFFPMIIKSSLKEDEAQKIAQKIQEISEKQNKKILFLASVDFSHYKDSQTAQDNDKKSIYAIENFHFDNVYDLDLDSPASIFAVMKFAQNMNSEFLLLKDSNSAILSHNYDIESTTSYVTGYFASKY